MKKIAFIILTLLFMSCQVQKDSKFDYNINKNEILEIKLESNPTTGYSWKWIKEDSNIILDSLGQTYVPKQTDSRRLGSGGVEIFKFKAIKSGIVSLKFKYNRSWEQQTTDSVKTFIIKVN